MYSSIAICSKAAALSTLTFSILTAADNIPTSKPPEIPLIVPAGVPLRLYLTKRLSKRTGAQVEAKVLEPVFAFDHQVIPEGATVLGQVSRLQPIPKSGRAQAILNGDFTPLHIALVEFTTLVMPDGRKVPMRTVESYGLDSIVPSRPPKTKNTSNTSNSQNTGVLGTGKQQLKDAVQAKIDEVKSIPDVVRGPDKKEIAEDYLVKKLPYHPQYVRKGTRFDAELSQPLSFGSEAVPPESLALLGTQPKAASVAHARLITPVDSSSSKPGDVIRAALAQPVYSPDHKLLLPEGTQLEGAVVTAKKARWFHRSGQVRFSFRDFELPPELASLQAAAQPATEEQAKEPQQALKIRTEANLQDAESSGKAHLKVDPEGGVQAQESKTRFLGAAAAVLIAQRAADNDAGRVHGGQLGGQDQNVGGRTLGGGFGFGLLGAAIAQSSRYVGTAFGYYGMAWALYSTIVARGSEVKFDKNAVIDIRFDTPAEKTAGPAAQADSPGAKVK